MAQDAIQSHHDKYKFFSCRVCWKVSLATFLAIIVVEIIILIPSYHNFSRDWQKSRQEQVLSAATAVFTAVGDNELKQSGVIAESLNKLLEANVILGWGLSSVGDSKLIEYAGSVPDSLQNTQLLSNQTELSGKPVLDFLWVSGRPNMPFDVRFRLSLDGLYEVLNGFILRIAGLVAIISLFVTVVTMLVLNRQILSPILKLRGHLLKAGAEIERPQAHVLETSRTDEMGDMVAAFNDMLIRSGENIQTVLAKEKELQLARDKLELRVKELNEEVLERQNVENQLKKNERYLYKVANYDALTNLPNRLLGLDRLRSALKHCQRNNTSGALMFIDLDHFKEINDTMGHGIGDELLAQTANRLLESLRGGDSVIRMQPADNSASATTDEKQETVARIGGDEFMVILPEIANEHDAGIVADRMSKSCAMPLNINNHEIFVTASIGISIFPRDGTDPQELMMSADTALYLVKDIGRNNYRFFSSEMNSKLVERMEIESLLRHAMDNGELSVFYQPIIDINTGNAVAVEALLRWNSQQLGWVSPEKFIPIAEDACLIMSIGEWVLEQACGVAKKLNDLGVPLRVAVNVSPRQFRDSGFSETVLRILADVGLPAHKLELEITERLLIDEQSDAFEAMNQLSQHGVRFSIDDFGTGYSALSYLQRFAVNTLKIDKSFISRVNESEHDAALARTIIAMAKNLDLEIIAEGVEDKAQHQFLQNHDCDLAQGFYFSEPMPMTDLLETLSISKVT